VKVFEMFVNNIQNGYINYINIYSPLKLGPMFTMQTAKKWLILFDLNGVLCTKIPMKKDPSRYTFLVREGIQDFLSSFGDDFCLGIYSSTSYANIKKVLATIDPERKIELIIDRGHTLLDPNYGTIKGLTEYDTVKNLDYVWSNPVFNKNRLWSANNTLLVDHSPLKVRFNDDKNILLIDEFTVNNTEDSLDELRESILSKLRELMFS
jgi:hypothetical protein